MNAWPCGESCLIHPGDQTSPPQPWVPSTPYPPSRSCLQEPLCLESPFSLSLPSKLHIQTADRGSTSSSEQSSQPPPLIPDLSHITQQVLKKAYSWGSRTGSDQATLHLGPSPRESDQEVISVALPDSSGLGQQKVSQNALPPYR